MGALVLDSEAASMLVQTRTRRTAPVRIRELLTAAAEDRHDVIIPAAVLAELYRGGRYDQAVDACLSRESGILIRDTDRGLARQVGNLLATAGWGSEHHVDAAVVAVANDAGGGVIATVDNGDIETLASPLSGIAVERV